MQEIATHANKLPLFLTAAFSARAILRNCQND
jgi:hypothetical protein